MKQSQVLLRLAAQLAEGDPIEDAGLTDSQTEAITASLRKIAGIRDCFKGQPSDVQNNLLGTQWLQLKITAKLGAGGIGVVYQAHDLSLDRFVALKVLRPSSLNFISQELFVEEAKRMAQVRHPHIMAVYGADINAGMAAFWGELLSGENLSDFLAKHDAVSVEQKIELAMQLADAVKAIHQKKMAHGDIKNLNIMIESDRGAVLMDFGAAKDMANPQAGNNQPMTPLAMAPEQFEGGGASQPADVFALGVVFYYLFNGGYPYLGSDYAELKQNVLAQQRQPTRLAGRYGPHITALIHTMLNHEPEPRPGIEQVYLSLAELRRLPLAQAKKHVWSLLFILLTAVASFSVYHAYQTSQANKDLLAANQATATVNEMLTELIRSPSHIEQGSQVLMKDVVLQKATAVQENSALSDQVRNRMLLAFAHSVGSFGEQEKQAELLQNIIDAPGSTDQYIMTALIQLAELRLLQNETAEAKQLLGAAEQQAPVLLKQLSLLKISLNDAYAHLYTQQQQFDLAMEYINQSVELWDTEPLNFDASATFSKQGNINLALSAFKAAKQSFAQCAEIAESFRGPENWNAIGCRLQLARILAHLGEFEQAIASYENTLPVASRFLDVGSSEIFNVRINYASVLANAGRTDRALQVGEKNLADAIKYNLPITVKLFIQNNLASGYINSGLFEKAEQIYVDLLPALIEHYSPTHEATFQAQSNLAELYHKTGQSQKAIDLLEVQIPKAQQSIGESNLATLEMQGSLAWSYHQLGRNDLALPLIQSVLARKTQVFGQAHPITQQAQQRLAAIDGRQ